MYNVLEQLRRGEPLTAKDKVIHEQGLVSVLRQLHDELDAAVLAAYGWQDLVEARGSGARGATGRTVAPPDRDAGVSPPARLPQRILRRTPELRSRRRSCCAWWR